MKIKYVGVKLDGETAFASESGIAVWLHGDAHEVKGAVAAKMLKHPDVFALDEAIKAAEPVQVAKVAEPVVMAETGIPATGLTPLESMTKEQLQELAKAKDIKVHHNAGIETLIKAIKAAE
jgi:hypothetical protein